MEKRRQLNLVNGVISKDKQKKGNGDCKLTEERICRLNTIDFIWNPITFVWEKNIKALNEFKENMVNIMAITTLQTYNYMKMEKKETINLGRWCHDQRQARKGEWLW